MPDLAWCLDLRLAHPRGRTSHIGSAGDEARGRIDGHDMTADSRGRMDGHDAIADSMTAVGLVGLGEHV